MNKPSLIIGLIIAVTTLLADQLSKWVVIEILALPTSAPIELTSFFRLTMVWNYGMSFGMLNNLGEYAPHFFTAVALGVSGALLYFMRKETRLWLIGAQGLIIGGALGNVIDRWRFGAVADFLDVHLGSYHWPAFNIADSAIFIGVALLMLDAFTEKKAEKNQAQQLGAEEHTVTKVGFLAVYENDTSEWCYLMYRPKPKKEEGKVLPYQLARGSIEEGEDTLTAAKREAEEELGVYEKDVTAWHDAGVMSYASKKKGEYSIHWYIAELSRETPIDPLPVDAAGLKWMSQAEVLKGMETGEIKVSYKQIFEVLISSL